MKKELPKKVRGIMIHEKRAALVGTPKNLMAPDTVFINELISMDIELLYSTITVPVEYFDEKN